LKNKGFKDESMTKGGSYAIGTFTTLESNKSLSRTRPTSLQLIGIILPKLETPLADGLMGHVDAALEQEFLHVAVAQREAIIQPDAMADDLPGEAVVFVAFGGSEWRHVWLPIGVVSGS
jgi:hypothetical protein